MKIYADDANLPYKSTIKKPIDSKRDIDAILARYGITKVMWEWNLPDNDIQLGFQLSEDFKDIHINPLIRMSPPIIWKKQRRNRPDEIDWRLSMRIFHWYIKNQLSMTYAMQSEKILAFLPYVAINEKETLKDVVIPHLEELKQFKALPIPVKPEKEKVIEAEYQDAGKDGDCRI